MPTIEIVSINCNEIPSHINFESFLVLCDNRLQTHRSLFQNEFDRVRGVIAHLGNNSLKGQEDDGWFAGALVDWSDDKELLIPIYDEDAGEEEWSGEDQTTTFHFLDKVLPDIRMIMIQFIEASPDNEVYFSTDYQFGPGEAEVRKGYTVERFLAEHSSTGLRWNTLYQVTQ